MKPKNNQEIAAALRGFYTSQVASLNGVLEDMPEPFKGELVALKAQINGVLEQLPLTDAVPAAQDMNWGLECLARAFSNMQEYSTRLNTLLNSMKQKVAGVPELVKHGITEAVEAEIKKRIEAGDLVTKETNGTLITTAEKRGRENGMAALKLVTARTASLNTAKLPIPGEEVLTLEEAVYAPKLEAAKSRHGKLTDLGIELNADTKDLNALLFGEQAAFDTQFNILNVALNGAGNPGGKTRRKDVDPLRGGGSGGGDSSGGLPPA